MAAEPLEGEDRAEPAVVAKFRADGALPEGGLPVASLCVLWYIEPGGNDGVVAKFDGVQQLSVTVGDLVAIVHDYLHADDDPDARRP